MKNRGKNEKLVKFAKINYNNILNIYKIRRDDMEFFQKLYDEHENVNVRFVGFSTDLTRYDFGIVYTNLFFTKPLVVCMQTGRSTLLDPKDLEDTEYLQKVFKMDNTKQTADLVEFFQDLIPQTHFEPEYE